MPVMAGRRRWRLAIADTIFGACMVLQLLLACSSQAQGQTSSLCNSECPPLRVPVNAVLHQNGTNVGNTTVIKCDSKSRQVGGDTSRTCLPNGRWTGYDITCYTYASLLSCSFAYSSEYCGLNLPRNASITRVNGHRVLRLDGTDGLNSTLSTFNSLLAKNNCTLTVITRSTSARSAAQIKMKVLVGTTSLPDPKIELTQLNRHYMFTYPLSSYAGSVSIRPVSNCLHFSEVRFTGECLVQITNDSACKNESTNIASPQHPPARCICPAHGCSTDLVHCNISVRPCRGWTNLPTTAATFHYLGPIIKPLINQVQGGIEPVIVFRTTGTPGSKITVEVTSALTRLTLRRKTLTADSTGVYTVSSLVSLNDTTLQTSASYLSIQGSGNLTYLTTRLPHLYARGICKFNVGKFCNLLSPRSLQTFSYVSSALSRVTVSPAVPNIGGYLRVPASTQIIRYFYDTLPAECAITLRVIPILSWDNSTLQFLSRGSSATITIDVDFEKKADASNATATVDCWMTDGFDERSTRTERVASSWTTMTVGLHRPVKPRKPSQRIKLALSFAEDSFVDDIEMAGCGTQRYCEFDNPCQAGGVCVEAYNPSGYECLCPENRSGIHCEKACVNPTTAPTTTPTT
eukprot:scpid58002/ scgid1882/ 